MSFLLTGISSLALCAQQLPPIEPPLPVPGSDAPKTDLNAITVKSTVVVVPTLVAKKDGTVLYGLKPQDFIVEDNGRPQQIRVDEDLDTAPVSVVVAVEQGRMSILQFQKFAHLGALLDLLIGDGRGEAALVTFDSIPHLATDFSADTEPVKRYLANLQPGDGGAAIYDTVGYATQLLAERPSSHRRVLLLVSEERDHGSRHYHADQLIKKIGLSDVLVLSVCYSASRTELIHDSTTQVDAGRAMNLMSPLVMAINAMKKNAARQIAVLSGGEFTRFTREKGFDDDVARLSMHARNRYLLSFQPTDPTPGLHSIRVKLAEDYGAKIVARTSYWAAER